MKKPVLAILAGGIALGSLGWTAPAHAFRDVGLCKAFVDAADPDRDDYIGNTDKAMLLAAVEKCTEDAAIKEASRIYALTLSRDSSAYAAADAYVLANPDSALAYSLRAYVKTNINAPGGKRDWDGAIADADRAIALRPNWAPPLRIKGFALLSLGKNQASAEAYERALAIYGVQPSANNNLAVVLNNLKRHPEALKYADRTIALVPNQSIGHWPRATALVGLQRYQEADASYVNAIKYQPDAADLRYERFKLLSERLKKPMADFYPDIAAAAKLVPGNFEYQINTAELALILNKQEESLAAYDASVKLKPSDMRARRGRVMLQYIRGMLTEQSPDLAWARANSKPGFVALINGMIALLGNKFVTGSDELKKALANNETGPLPRSLLGAAYASQGKCDLALPELNSAIGDEFTFFGVYYFRGNCLLDTGKNAEALADFNTILRDNPDDALSISGKATALANLNRKQEAVSTADAYVARRKDSDSHIVRAQLFAKLGQWAKALADLDRANALTPLKPAGHGQRGNVLNNLGRYGEAAAAYRQAAEQQPDNANWQNGVCWNLALAKNGAGAMPFCERAVELAPGEAAIVHSLGRALEVSGDKQGAIRQYRRSLVLDPQLKEARDDLARLGAAPL